MSTKTIETVYVSKYALTSGIRALQAEIVEAHDSAATYASVVKPQLFLRIGRDAHYTYEDAVKAAEQMRKKKIASLKKQIKKLAALTFATAAPEPETPAGAT